MQACILKRNKFVLAKGLQLHLLKVNSTSDCLHSTFLVFLQLTSLHIYTHTPGPSSSLAAIVVVPVVILVVIAILCFVDRARKKHNKLTETANFKFVDLSDQRSCWQRASVAADRVADMVRKPSKPQKIGLVNLVDSQQDQEDLYGSVSVSIQ